MILPITSAMAGAATLINIWLARRVGQVRVAHKVYVGDGANETLTRRMRAQANFVEYTPFFLILLLLVELAVGAQFWLWIVGALYILARILHAFGMDGGRLVKLRLIGIVVTALVLVGLAGYTIYLSYSGSAASRAGEAAARHRAR